MTEVRIEEYMTGNETRSLSDNQKGEVLGAVERMFNGHCDEIVIKRKGKSLKIDQKRLQHSVGAR